jgi:transposase-like protein
MPMALELRKRIFHDPIKARKWLEGQRWPDGPVCSHCGSINGATAMKSRPGLYQCKTITCRKHFTIMTGTIFESSHIPLHKWLLVIFLVCGNEKHMTGRQLHRMIGVSYRSTWFMMYRIREAISESNLKNSFL